MNNRDLFYEKLAELEDYFEYVDTDIDSLMQYDLHVYAAYAVADSRITSTIAEWYREAEESFISPLCPDLYVMGKYGVFDSWAVDELINTEEANGLIYNIEGYWFESN